MKHSLKISSDDLRPAISKLAHVVHPKAPLPVLSHLLCKVSKNQMELIGSNTEITILYRLECQAEETFEFLLPFEFLSKIVALNKHTPLEIIAGSKVKIKTEADQYELKISEKIDEFPKLPTVPKKNSVTLTAATMASMHTALGTIAPPTTDKPQFLCVLLSLTPGKVTVASTDGSYAVYSKEMDAVNEETEDLLISNKVIKVLEPQDVKLNFHDKAIAFETEALTVIATRGKDRFADYKKIFPVDWPVNLTVAKSALQQALQKCALASDKLMKTTIEFPKPGQLHFKALDHKVNIDLTISGEYTGDVEVTAIHSQIFLDVLGQVETDIVSLALHDGKRPIVITCENDPGYKGLIMPIAV